MKVLFLCTDAYGGRGGMAKFNRDFLSSICASPSIDQVVAIPRLMPDTPIGLPPKLEWITSGLGGKTRYLAAAVREGFTIPRFDWVVCGHISLLPLAWLVSRLTHCPLWCVIHGIDAWQPHRSALVNQLVDRTDGFIAVSDTTRKRFTAWSGVPVSVVRILPNCYDPALFFAAPKNETLVERYGLRGKTVLLTLGRLAGRERFKGFDEVIQILPELSREIPGIVYLIVGDGDDRPRLVDKARTLGVSDRVIFAGYIPEAEKADHYRLADVYVMPSRGEGFGIVFLEALACGLPVIGSKLDGSRDALAGGQLGQLVDPGDPQEILQAIRTTLKEGCGNPPEGLSEFSLRRFEETTLKILDLAVQKKVI